jgi:hypothetical protein
MNRVTTLCETLKSNVKPSTRESVLEQWICDISEDLMGTHNSRCIWLDSDTPRNGAALLFFEELENIPTTTRFTDEKWDVIVRFSRVLWSILPDDELENKDISRKIPDGRLDSTVESMGDDINIVRVDIDIGN